MKVAPRIKLLLLVAIFVLPIVASVFVYNFARPRPTANYGELVQPPRPVDPQPYVRAPAAPFRFAGLAGRWIVVASGPAACEGECLETLRTMRQVRLALGRNASRVERVFVTAGSAPANLPEELAGTAAIAPAAGRRPAEPFGDPAHIYLVDPNGNVMLRWPARPDARRMLRDLERLLKASQIG